MEECYQRRLLKSSPISTINEGMFYVFDKRTKTGTMIFGIKSNGKMDTIVHLLDFVPVNKSSSKIILHSKGDFGRTTQELEKNLPLWLENKKGKCRGSLFKGEFWREV
jgi:hypothetical protein